MKAKVDGFLSSLGEQRGSVCEGRDGHCSFDCGDGNADFTIGTEITHRYQGSIGLSVGPGDGEGIRMWVNQSLDVGY